jgi:hypothetical protein
VSAAWMKRWTRSTTFDLMAKVAEISMSKPFQINKTSVRSSPRPSIAGQKIENPTVSELRGLREKTGQYCVVMQTLLRPPALHTEWVGAG